jgi:ABC-type transporter Mla MlaB component
MAKGKMKNFKVTPAKSNGDKIARVDLQGDLSLNTIVELKDLLLDIIDKYQQFDIKISNVDTIDLGFMQLLQSFRWTAEKQKKVVELEFSLTDEQAQLLSNAGLGVIIKSN